MRTIATLRPPYKSQSYSFPSGLTIAAALFGGAWWLLPQRSANATKTAPSDDFLEETDRVLCAAIRFYLGCQNVIFGPPTPLTPDVEVVVILDADATSEDGKGRVVGVRLTSFGRKEVEMVGFLGQILEGCEEEGLLRKQGKAVCHLSCSDANGIWAYGGPGVEVPGAHLRPWGEEGGWLKRIVTTRIYNVTGEITISPATRR